MFMRWKKAVLVIWLMCFSKVRLLSIMTEVADGDRVELLTERLKLWVLFGRNFRPMIIMSDLL